MHTLQELQDWLKHPVTKSFQQVLEKEALETKSDLSNQIDSTVLDRDDLLELVTVNKSIRTAYAQFYGDGAKETIINMFNDHEMITQEEEDSNDTD
jgi:hypothetical protein